MDLEFKAFEDVTITPLYGNYSCQLKITGVDEETVMDQFTPEDLNRLISKIPLKDVIDYHGEEEVLETIGEQRVKEHVTEYWTQSDEEHE